MTRHRKKKDGSIRNKNINRQMYQLLNAESISFTLHTRNIQNQN
jgi:hypothetical protein